MKRTSFKRHPCSVARTVDLLGDWWTPLVLRECFYGVRRFDEFQDVLGIGRNVLTERLKRLVSEDILCRKLYQERPKRFEYRLTVKGRQLFSVICAMMRWGDDWLWPKGAPIELRDRRTGARIVPVVVDESTGEPVDVRNVYALPGPSLPKKYRTHRRFRVPDDAVPPQ